jgi:hypothetical protein
LELQHRDERQNREESSRLQAQVQMLRKELALSKEGQEEPLSSVKLYFFTVAKDWNKDGHDDGIEAAVQPLDLDGNTMKVRGSCRFELYRTSFLGLGRAGRRISEWEFSVDKLKDSWLDSTFSGFYFQLPWGAEKPIYKKVVLRMIFETPAGKKFEDEKVINLKL